MSVYYKYLPQTIYKKKLVTDLTRRVDFRNTVFNDPFVFLPYTIQYEFRPEDVAEYYYGGVQHTWLVYLSGNIIDPYKDWPMTADQFNRYLMKKYETLSGTTGYPVIAWTQNEGITDNIVHYKNNDDEELIISKETYGLDTSLVQGDWTPVRYYEYEDNLNEQRRAINLFDKKYLPQAIKEFRKLMNVGTV